MKKTSNRLSTYLLIVFGCFIQSVFISNAQNEQKGMKSQSINYTTFSERETHNSLPYNAPCEDCIEDVAARTEYTRTFNGTGSKKGLVYSQSGYTPLNVKDENNNWITFDNRLRFYQKGLYIAPDQHAPITVNLNEGYNSIKNTEGEIKFNKDLELFWKTGVGEVSLGKANFRNHTAGDDGVYITDAWPGIDIAYEQLLERLKQIISLKIDQQKRLGFILFEIILD